MSCVASGAENKGKSGMRMCGGRDAQFRPGRVVEEGMVAVGVAKMEADCDCGELVRGWRNALRLKSAR